MARVGREGPGGGLGLGLGLVVALRLKLGPSCMSALCREAASRLQVATAVQWSEHTGQTN